MYTCTGHFNKQLLTYTVMNSIIDISIEFTESMDMATKEYVNKNYQISNQKMFLKTTGGFLLFLALVCKAAVSPSYLK